MEKLSEVAMLWEHLMAPWGVQRVVKFEALTKKQTQKHSLGQILIKIKDLVQVIKNILKCTIY